MRGRSFLCCSSPLLLATTALAGGSDWVSFNNESGNRIIADSGLVANDPEEKDYAWGDVDNDGDDDLVIARKQPFTTPGRKTNVLLMNEGVPEGHDLNGVLVDRTAEFASAADDGGNGFLDETNDRDIILVDVDNDGWLDIVTAPAYGQGLPKTISHPRIYMNQGEIGGVWQGFLYEEARIPVLQEAPNLCAVTGGDVTGDNFADLYFVTYNSSFEDFLLVNDGNGFFTDQTSQRMGSDMIASGFGTAGYIVDFNDDGWNDIIKSENGPIDILYNDTTGNFSEWENVANDANYHVGVGDLNNDGRMDFFGSSDGQDLYRINIGNGPNGLADFTSFPFQIQNGGDDGFASNSVAVDLDNDTFEDVLIADVDVDVGGCSRRLHIYHNLGDVPNVTMIEQGTGGIPTSMLNGTHDVAAFDVNGDGFKDLVIGRCNTTEVWINEPPFAVSFGYPNGQPDLLTPDQVTPLQVQITPIGGDLDPNSPQLFASINGGPFQQSAMTPIGGSLYEAQIPAAACGDVINYYVQADLVDDLGSFTDPPNAPGSTYFVQAAAGIAITFQDQMEGDVSGWEVLNQSVANGEWEAADPLGTMQGVNIAAPFDDATVDGDIAFITENGVPGGSVAAADLDGGPTRLTSPVIDLAGTDGTIKYARWMYTSGGVTDQLVTEISNDNGQTWVQVSSISSTNDGNNTAWEETSFVVSNYVTPTSQIRVRFSVADQPNDSITESGIDNFSVESLVCDEPCDGDFDNSGTIDTADLLALLAAWGTNGDGANLAEPFDIVSTPDLLVLLAAWGDCP